MSDVQGGGGSIGLDPIPPHQGDTAKVTAPGPYPRTVRGQFDNEPPFDIVITNASGTAIQIPSNATVIVLTDPRGVLTGNGSAIAP